MKYTELYGQHSYDYISPADFMGTFKSNDSLNEYVHFGFIHSGNSFCMYRDSSKTNTMEGFNCFIFRKDDQGYKSTGVLARWPPVYCYIRLMDANCILIEYDGISSVHRLVTYYRIE